METSLRYGGDSKVQDSKAHRLIDSSKSLRIHAKQKLPIDSNTFFQVHGELDTKFGHVNSFGALIRHFYPQLSATLGVGVRYDKHDKLRYIVAAKQTFPVTVDGLLNFKIKGQCLVDEGFKERKSGGAAELSWSIFNFQKDQDLRLRFGYEVFEQFKEARLITKCCSDHQCALLTTIVLTFELDGVLTSLDVPYLQIRENNWTLNADYKGRWNVRYDL
ncbi:hypothetical protein RIF29_13014 [Crotalaria pallida]|uniref:Uncharacterized protein n=1 Tax=Crotalaria pallida TaxID=3830 RepID=A0AAN9P1J2_CROPI